MKLPSTPLGLLPHIPQPCLPQQRGGLGRPQVGSLGPFDQKVAGLGLPKERVAHIGDSIHHDVAGAAGAAVPVVFIAGGIEHEALGIEPGELPAPEAVRRLCEWHGTQPPTHTAALVRWDAPVM